MKTKTTRAAAPSPERSTETQAVEDQMQRTFTPAWVDELRALTGYNPRQRHGTALRLMLTVVEGFLAGQTLTFASLRAIFVRRFGFIRSCPFQKRFKQESAAAFFREALKHFVDSVVCSAGLTLSGPLARFADVRIYDGTGQRVPPRGRDALPACTKRGAPHLRSGSPLAVRVSFDGDLIRPYPRRATIQFCLCQFPHAVFFSVAVAPSRGAKPALGLHGETTAGAR